MLNLKNIFDIIAARRKAAACQRVAHSYWKSCTNSYIGPEALYLKQEEALRRVFVPKIKPEDEILDIGCSNGRFAFIVSKYCKHIDSFDLSPDLIEAANNQARHNGIKNIHFFIQDIKELNAKKLYDHILCMGLFTAIPDEKITTDAITKLPQMLKKNGYLVIKDTLTSAKTRYYVNGEYAASYRNEKAYVSLFERVGMKLEAEETLCVMNLEMSSKLLLFKYV